MLSTQVKVVEEKLDHAGERWATKDPTLTLRRIYIASSRLYAKLHSDHERKLKR